MEIITTLAALGTDKYSAWMELRGLGRIPDNWTHLESTSVLFQSVTYSWWSVDRLSDSQLRTMRPVFSKMEISPAPNYLQAWADIARQSCFLSMKISEIASTGCTILVDPYSSLFLVFRVNQLKKHAILDRHSQLWNISDQKWKIHDFTRTLSTTYKL